MINIQDTKVFYYDQDRKTVTVYHDFDVTTNKWYIVPTPRFSTVVIDGSTEVAFSLVEYTTNDGLQGTCAFTVELAVDPDALDAVHRNLGFDIDIGQFDWVSALAYLEFQVEGKSVIVNAVPSQYASNAASFVVFLPDQVTVNTFKNAFGPGGKTISTIAVQYDLLALAKLPAVDVKVTYKSTIAYEYEKTIHVDRNFWGKETSRSSTIKEFLQNSDAGDTEIDWHLENPGPELEQRVYDWAWVTLENLVAEAVDSAVRRLGANNSDKFSISAVSSFERTYSENQVIEWAISPKSFLPAFNAQQWDRYFRTVENRNLVVGFTLLDDLAANEIDSVQVTVKYPTKGTDESFVFTSETATTWTYAADGAMDAGRFDPNYQYQYIVRFKDEPAKTYTSEWIADSRSTVVLPVASLGIQSATFVATNIDFENAVDFILLDFFYRAPDGQPNTAEQVRIKNTNPKTITSRTFLPSTNEYTYQLLYVMKDGNRYTVQPLTAFPPENRRKVFLTSPFRTKEVGFTLWNPHEDSKPTIIQVNVKGVYQDPLNDYTATNLWKFKPPEDEDFFEPETPWIVNVPNNPNGAWIQYDGYLLMSNGKQRKIIDVKDKEVGLVFSSIDSPFTVTFDPFQIDWASADRVYIDVWTHDEDPGESQAVLLAAEPVKTNIASIVFMRPPTDAAGEIRPAPEAYYTFNFPVGKSSFYYYTVEYSSKEGNTTIDCKSSDVKRVVLPPKGKTPPPLGAKSERFIHRVRVEHPEE